MNYFPIMLQVQGKRCLVIGGGQIATRKVRSLLQAQADITVISPLVTEEIKRLAEEQVIRWKEKEFEKEDIVGAFVIIAATNQASVNHEVYQAAEKNQLINIVDQPELSNFIVPSSFRRGKLTISVSTSGASPGLSRQITRDLAKQYDDAYEEYLIFLEAARKRVLAEVKDPQKKQEILKELLQPQYLEWTRLGQLAEREERLTSLLNK